MRRTERLFALAEALRARRTGITAEQLAERFHVTVRTMYRDLDALRDASLPLHAERGRGGGYALDRAYSLPPVNFTAREAALLVTLGRWAIASRRRRWFHGRWIARPDSASCRRPVTRLPTPANTYFYRAFAALSPRRADAPMDRYVL